MAAARNPNADNPEIVMLEGRSNRVIKLVKNRPAVQLSPSKGRQ